MNIQILEWVSSTISKTQDRILSYQALVLQNNVILDLYDNNIEFFTFLLSIL